MSKTQDLYQSPFGLKKEMGYTREDFFTLLPRLFLDELHEVTDNRVTVAFEGGQVNIVIGEESVRQFTDLVSFPILPIEIQFSELGELEQSHFLKRFDHLYMKGLG